MDRDRLPAPNQNNLWYHHTGGDAVLVFVHGLLSDSRGCWLHDDGSTPIYWPDLIETDARFGDIALYLAGYYTEVDSGDFPIQQCAQQVYSYLRTPDAQGRPPVMDKHRIVFVCHSMGGIVARYLLCEHHEAFREKRVGIVLIASPSYGSQLARSLNEVVYLYNHAQGTQLKWGSAILRDLDQRFKNLKESGRIPHLFGVELFENRFVVRSKWLPLFARTKVVTEESAARYFGYAKQIGGSDHSSISKPKASSDAVHQYLLEFLLDKDLLPARCAAPAPPAADGPVTGAAVATVRPPVTSLQISVVAPGAAGAWWQGSGPLGVGFEPAQVASHVALALAGPSQAALVQAAQERPRLEELFEVVTDPDLVSSALFGAEAGGGLAPHDVAYVNGREGVADIQDAMDTALREARGRLLVCGPRGIGKTREMAELARTACAATWRILVARNEANSRLGPLVSIPADLLDARLLIVVDNLHLRVTTGADDPTPYLDRLGQLLAWFDERLPGSVRVLATSRDEPRFQQVLGLPPQGTAPWRGFGVFRLPPLTDDGLRQMLASLAARAGVTVDAADVGPLVENSDRKPATVFINVELARRKRVTLTSGAWRPTEGESWRLRFADARAEHPGVDRVCQALHLVTRAGLPARVPYVAAVAHACGVADPDAVVHALVAEGLLRRRQGALTPFSPEQLDELLGGAVEAVLEPAVLADILEGAITETATRPAEWADDLLAFSLGLDRAGHVERAAQAVSSAIELAAGGARAYRIRAGIRVERRDFPGAEDDLSRAIEMGDDDPDARFGRAALRNLRGHFAAALDDLDVVMHQGRDDAAVHGLRAAALYLQARWADAAAALTAAMERGETSGMTFFARGMARFQLDDATGAEADLSEALVRGIGLDQVAVQLRQIEAPGTLDPGAAPGGAGGGTGLVRALRGIARFRLGRHAAADDDLTAAIEAGASAEFNAFVGGLGQSTLPMLEGVKDQLRDLPVPFGDGRLFHLRGVARLSQDELADAEADFTEALARGFDDGEVYFGRALARLRLERLADAESDAAAAVDRGRHDAPTHGLRGAALLGLNRFADADQALTTAIGLDENNAQLFAWRGVARMHQHLLAEAEADFDLALGRQVEARTLFWRGCVRFDLQKFIEAEQDLTGAADRDFEPAALFTLRGLTRLALDNLAGADADADAAFARGANDVQAYSLQAAVRLVQERWAEADEALTAAIGLGRLDPWVCFHRGRARHALERYAEAEEDFDAALAFGSEAASRAQVAVADLLANRGRTRMALEKWPDAELDFSAVVDAGRDDAFVHYCLGLLRHQQKRYADAEAGYDRALARDDRPVVRSARAWTRLARGRFQAAEHDLAGVIAHDPADVQALYARAICRRGQRRYTEALADCDSALAVSPDHVGVLATRVAAGLHLGDADDAVADVARLETIDPDGAETRGCYGLLALARGDLDEALRQLTDAAARDPGWSSLQGLALLLLDRPAEACEAYGRAAVTATPGDDLLDLDALEHYVGRFPGRVASPDALAALADIRARLAATPRGSSADAPDADR
jgi:tetratricopeptide (TPR) repeat protein